MPIAYGYGRISTDETRQVYSLASQETVCKQASDSIGLTWGGMFADSDTSGSVPLFERTAGRELNLRLNSGDHLFVAKADRAFRSMRDQVIVCDSLRVRGVVLHFLDMNLDTSTYEGMLICTVLAWCAERERARIIERTKDANRQARLEGRDCNVSQPIGWKVQGRGREAKIVPDYQEREICKEIHELYQCQPGVKSWFTVRTELLKVKRPVLRRHKGRFTINDKTIFSHGKENQWKLEWLKRAERAYRLGFPNETVQRHLAIRREAGLLPTAKPRGPGKSCSAAVEQSVPEIDHSRNGHALSAE